MPKLIDLVDNQARGVGGQVQHIRGTGLGNHFPAERRDRNGNILDILFPLLGGHDHFFQNQDFFLLGSQRRGGEG